MPSAGAIGDRFAMRAPRRDPRSPSRILPTVTSTARPDVGRRAEVGSRPTRRPRVAAVAGRLIVGRSCWSCRRCSPCSGTPPRTSTVTGSGSRSCPSRTSTCSTGVRTGSSRCCRCWSARSADPTVNLFVLLLINAVSFHALLLTICHLGLGASPIHRTAGPWSSPTWSWRDRALGRSARLTMYSFALDASPHATAWLLALWSYQLWKRAVEAGQGGRRMPGRSCRSG